jgi:hypothetical protein
MLFRLFTLKKALFRSLFGPRRECGLKKAH